ncbi:MAG: ABC transporter permease [Gammaproteobacteria bacterium]|nr:ABC transporter permease [Gammaproteobacteria bacterium]|tara:strand:+ start:4792 stop:5562 length:771 start_codon:yes stop_codon:yes gene_type:complete
MKREILIAYNTIVRKEFVRFARIWIQTILPSVITIFLYITIFGNFIGDRIGEIQDFNYVDYIIPGLIIMPIISNSYMNVVGSFYSSRFQKSHEELMVSPVPDAIILLGYITGGVMRAFVVGIAVYIVTIFFTEIPIYNLSLVILITFLTAFLFSTAGFINAIYAKSFDDINIVTTFVLTPLTYLGGTFYSIDALPQIWQDISIFNPIAYIISAYRLAFLGIEETSIVVSIAIIIILIFILFFAALMILSKGIGIKN